MEYLNQIVTTGISQTAILNINNWESVQLHLEVTWFLDVKKDERATSMGFCMIASPLIK